MPAGAARVIDQKQGQASSHVPIGFSIRISCAYGIHDCGNRSSHVPVTMGCRVWPLKAVAASAAGLLPSAAPSPLLPPPLVGSVLLLGCWLLACSRSDASRLAGDVDKGRLSCSCAAQAKLAVLLAAAAGGRQVLGLHPAGVKPPLACNQCSTSPRSWVAAASALGTPPAPSSAPLLLAQAASIPPCCSYDARWL